MDKLDSALGLLAQVRSDVMALGKEASERADMLDARVKELEAELSAVRSVIVYDDPKRTEVVLRDRPTVWVYDMAQFELGYDLETGELIAVRVFGDVSKRKE